MICDPVDHIMTYGFIVLGLVMVALGGGAYWKGNKTLDEAIQLRFQWRSFREQARIERDQWKFANMLSTATNKGTSDETQTDI